MNNKPLVTIGIPTYNRPDGLKHTLQCAIRQNYENLEIIVSDNASGDELAIKSIIDSIDDPRVVYYRQNINIGAAANFEFIYKTARGKYTILMPDDDDYYDPNLITEGVKALEENPNASLAYGTVEYVDGAGQVFLSDNCPYGLDGNLIERLEHYIRFDITDHIFYGLIRTNLIKDYVFLRDVVCPEKFFILQLISNGSVADTPGMTYRNVYTFRGWKNEKHRKVWNLVIENLIAQIRCSKNSLYWVRFIFNLPSVPIPSKINLLMLFSVYRMTIISWPFRKLMGCKIKNLPGRLFVLNDNDILKTKIRYN